MQVERLTYQLAVMPETKTLLGEVDRMSLAGSAADRLATDFPVILASEREAIINQLTARLEYSSNSLRRLSTDVRSTLATGTETAEAMEPAIAAADAQKSKFAANSKASEQGIQPSRPFDVREYTELASHSRRLRENSKFCWRVRRRPYVDSERGNPSDKLWRDELQARQEMAREKNHLGHGRRPCVEEAQEIPRAEHT
jgi:hypothetical protein